MQSVRQKGRNLTAGGVPPSDGWFSRYTVAISFVPASRLNTVREAVEHWLDQLLPSRPLERTVYPG